MNSTKTSSLPIVNARPAQTFAAARNTCKLCAPLGACQAFRGVEHSTPLLHGSQGCATYIRRYLISHFKEPIDIASSNFDEGAAVYGGEANLRTAVQNIIRQYQPRFIGIATTCLSETIGDDVQMHLRALRTELGPDGPALVHVATPSYSGTHAEGYRAAVRAIVGQLAVEGPRHDGINVIASQFSPADLRGLKALFAAFGLKATILPDYSDTLDAPAWSEYHRITPGGTPLADIARMGAARATIEFAPTGLQEPTAGKFLEERFGIPCHRLSMPMGVSATDDLCELLETLSGRATPDDYDQTRGRLVDAYIDAHKHVFGRRAIVYGEPDLVLGLAAFLAEIGIVPVLCGTGSTGFRLRQQLIAALGEEQVGQTVTIDGADFLELEEAAQQVGAEIVIGSSKGYPLARKLGVPLVRVGFPIHDRIDGPRLLHLGYHGAQQLFDRIANALIGAAQDASPVGYAYM